MAHAAVLIGYLDQDNLGIGYLASVLLREGFRPIILDYRLGPERILENIASNQPLVVGFSLIFQYYTSSFREMMRHLRENGIECHFTAGGHYPSLRFRDVLDAVPELDSVVRFEGEYTCLELVQALAQRTDWTGIQGLAYRGDGGVVENPLRPLEPDLDKFPIPVRGPVRPESLGRKEATIVAGRGCLYNCSFCSIRQFYSAPPGPLKRIRRPEMVVEEMALLHEELGCTIFLFQDDDFPGTARDGQAWAERFCELLHARGLAGKLLWKISCRADEVGRERMALMRDAGLFLVYLGIESGNDAGLKLMNKHLNSEVNAAAVRELERLGLVCEFGFMLFDPLSTCRTVRDNLDFLDRICGDGYTPVTGCKMIPYGGTAIEEALRESHRLKAFQEHEDYDFLDPAVDALYGWFAGTFVNWMQAPRGLLNLSRTMQFDLGIHERCPASANADGAMRRTAREWTSVANRFFASAIREALSVCEAAGPWRAQELAALTRRVQEFESDLAPRLFRLIQECDGQRGETVKLK
jgi:radical SAM superfamily enzyme YgiQ (UPF0313 family)